MESAIKDYATILSNISDLSYDTTTEILLHIKMEFGLNTREDIHELIDNLNELQNNYPVPLNWLASPTLEQSIIFSVSAYRAIKKTKITEESADFLVRAMKILYDMRSEESIVRINESKRISELLISQLESENLKRLVDIALDTGNKELFIKLTREMKRIEGDFKNV